MNRAEGRQVCYMSLGSRNSHPAHGACRSSYGETPFPSTLANLLMSLYCRLSVQRLRTLQQKKEAQAKASRRDIATLIERGKIETARIKVETSM